MCAPGLENKSSTTQRIEKALNLHAFLLLGREAHALWAWMREQPGLILQIEEARS
jgi:hypothetical protein